LNALEAKLYLALQGARTIVAATANVNPAALRILRLVDSAISDYNHVQKAETPPDDDESEEDEEASNAA
jgi:hypothetical protein